MANKKITELTAATTLADTDLAVVVTDPAGSAATKKITIANLKADILEAPTVTTSLAVSGTVTATLFSGSGASLTSIPAANITGTLPAISGANLTSLNGASISSGNIAFARIANGLVSAQPTVQAITGTLALLSGGYVAGTESGAIASISLNNTGASNFITMSSTPNLYTSTTPTGATALWLKVSIGGTAYRIALQAAS